MGYGGFCTENAKFFYFFEKKFLGGGMGVFRETKKSRTLSVFHSRPRLSFPPPLPFPRKRESRGAASSATHRRRRHCTSASRNFPLTREEIPAFAGMEYGAGMEVFFYPPPLAGGGCERDSGRGGWSVADDVWDFATPQKFALRIFTPPRKRRRVRFMLVICRGKPLPAFFATPESHALPLRCRCRCRK